MVKPTLDLLLYNGNITTLDPQQPEVSAIGIKDGVVVALGSDQDLQILTTYNTQKINLHQRRVIPGLNDSHLHLIRGGLNYAMELRWDGIPSLTYAMTLLKEQVYRTPPPQWVRVVGGWSEFQFAEKRMPTLAEINAISPDTPIFILHLYDRALLNAAALRAVGYTKHTPEPIGGRIERDAQGNPTGLIIAEPNAMILYATLAKGPTLAFEDQIKSTRLFMRELNRLGLTSCIDAGGGFQNYPDNYKVIETLHSKGQLTIRIAYNLFTQKPGEELADFQRWSTMITPYSGDAMYRHNGAGEMLVFSAADFEDFLYPRPDLKKSMESELKKVVQFLSEKRWPFRLHATYNETISRALTVFEEINKEVPFNNLRWFFDHAETVSTHNLERIKALHGAIAIQHRMAYQGEYFINRYGKEAAQKTPPIQEMLLMDIPVGAGTDATRVASYNPWVCLYWLVTGNTVGGTSLYEKENRLSRLEALRLYTHGSAYFSREEDVKGTLSIGMYADLAVLSHDYFHVPEMNIKDITSILTVVGGTIVYAADDFSDLGPEELPISPDWSPAHHHNGYYQANEYNANASFCNQKCTITCKQTTVHPWLFGCDCFI